MMSRGQPVIHVIRCSSDDRLSRDRAERLHTSFSCLRFFMKRPKATCHSNKHDMSLELVLK